MSSETRFILCYSKLISIFVICSLLLGNPPTPSITQVVDHEANLEALCAFFRSRERKSQCTIEMISCWNHDSLITFTKRPLSMQTFPF